MVIQNKMQWGLTWIQKSLQGVNNMDIEPTTRIARMCPEQDLSQKTIVLLKENLRDSGISYDRVDLFL